MSDETTVRSWTKDKNNFFDLSPAKLAKALEASFDMEGLSDAQKIYAGPLLLSIASAAAPLMEEQMRAAGGMPARMLSPTHSLGRMRQHEEPLYALIESGNVEAVKKTTEPQEYTFTTHPNFSRSAALVDKSREVISALGDLNRDEIQGISDTGALPKAISRLLTDLKPMIKTREKRTRADELNETAVTMIPVTMEGATRQIQLIKDRKFTMHGREETEKRGNAGTSVRRSGELEFTSTDQLKAVAQLLPKYNSWFVDGDGKRTSHVYDVEVAVPALKRATLEQYAKGLKEVHGNVDGFSTSLWKTKLADEIAVLKDVEALAVTRMNAFNTLHDSRDALRAEGSNNSKRTAYKVALNEATAASQAYIERIHGTDQKTGKKVTDLMMDDTAGDLKTELEKGLNAIYAGKDGKSGFESFKIKPEEKAAAEDLFIKLERYGNYGIRMQRRENAAQYREALEFLIQKESSLKDVILEDETLQGKYSFSRHQINARMKSDPEFYSGAVEALAKSAMNKDDSRVRDAILETYKELSFKLENDLGDKIAGNQTKIVMDPLESRELLTLDALGHYNMARLYPEAMAGGYVIAEFAQPDLDLLKGKDEKAIRDDVVRLARTDMQVQILIANGMQVPKVAIIPLHEDPATIANAHSAQGALREGPTLDYMLAQIGADTPDGAKENALRHIGKDGQPEPLTAYQYMRHLGLTDQDMQRDSLDLGMLKKAHVLEGPDYMWACSDVGKRGTVIGSEEVEQASKETNLAAAKHPVNVDGQIYIIFNAQYPGQGGSFARANKVPRSARQETMQGEHQNNTVGATLGHDGHQRMLTRLYHREEATTEPETPAQINARQKVLERVTGGVPYNAGNVLGETGGLVSANERELINITINARLASTRDDARYDEFLKKYGEIAPNYSARPDNKGGEKKAVSFDAGRAIGIAAMEQGIFSNIIGIAELYNVVDKGIDKGKVTNGKEIRNWVNKDPYMQHLMASASIVANLVDLEEKWHKGGIAYKEENGKVTLTKGGETVPLETLLKAYDAGPQVQQAGSFDAGDLVMAHLTEQALQLNKGLLATYPEAKGDITKLIHPAHRDTVMAYKKLEHDILKGMHDSRFDEKDQKLIQGAYYLLLEGGNLFQTEGLKEQQIANAGAKRGGRG